MRITREHGSYNRRRYSRPWIGKITDWPIGSHPEIKWGACLSQPGDEGQCEIEAEPGDIIRSGQKDMRRNGGSNLWHIVQPDGTLIGTTPEDAREHWMKRSLVCPT